MAQKKFSSSPPSSETKPNTKLVGKPRTIVNKPNKQNVYEIDPFNIFNFSQLQEILDTLIDVKRPSHGKLKLANSCWQSQVGVCERPKNSR